MNDPTGPPAGATPAPAVTGVIPATGGTAGGTPVTVNGSGFTGATAVNFGAAGAAGVQIVSDTQLTAVSPVGSGVVDVTVVTPAGTSATSTADQFTYISLLAQVAPSFVACNSSTAGLQPKSVLTLSVYNPSSVGADMKNSGLRIEFGVDPGGMGSAGALIASQYTAGLQTSGIPKLLRTVDAAVIGGSGWNISPIPDAPCAFLAIPGTGPGQGTIAANGNVTFTFALDVDLVPGSSPVAISVMGVSDPATVTSTPLLVLKTPPVLEIQNFTASPAQLNPPSNWSVLTWQTAGAAQCQLTWTEQTTRVAYQGKDLPPGSTVPYQTNVLEPIVATLQASDSFTLTAMGAAPTTESYGVTLSAPSLQSSLGADPWATPCVAFDLSWTCFSGSGPVFNWDIDTGMEVTVRLVSHPATLVTAIAPDTGPASGGTTVTITGSGFTDASAVTFGPLSAGMTIISDTQLTAVSPPGVGTVDITVTTPGGTSASGTADQFTYTTAAVPPPVVTGVSPATGTATGGVSVVITGSGFAGALAVSFGPLSAAMTIISDTQLTAVSPPGVGTVDITVTTPGGTSAPGTADQFTYIPAVTNYQPTPINTGALIPDTGTANVTLTPQPGSGQTTFTISVAGEEQVKTIVNVNPVSLTSPLLAGTPWIDHPSGQQWVTLTWSAQNANATGFTIARDGTTITPTLAYDTSEYTVPLSNPAQTATFTITAEGYVTSNSTTTQSVVVSPALQILDFTTSASRIVRGQGVTLSWNVIAFTTVSVFELEGGQETVIHTSTPGAATSLGVTPSVTTAYGINAYGAAGQTAGPVYASVTVTKPGKEHKDKEKEEKEDLLEKQSKDHEPQILPGLLTGESDAPDPGLPGGSRGAFIEPDERPDVGAHLRNDGSGA